MKVGLDGTGVVALAGVVVVVGVVGYLLIKFGPKLKTLATETLNPASGNNIVNQGVTAAVSKAVGYNESLGGALYDLTHTNVNPPTSPKVKATVAPLSGIDSAGFGPAPYQTLPRVTGAGFGPDVFTKSSEGDYSPVTYDALGNVIN